MPSASDAQVPSGPASTTTTPQPSQATPTGQPAAGPAGAGTSQGGAPSATPGAGGPRYSDDVRARVSALLQGDAAPAAPATNPATPRTATDGGAGGAPNATEPTPDAGATPAARDAETSRALALVASAMPELSDDELRTLAAAPALLRGLVAKLGGGAEAASDKPAADAAAADGKAGSEANKASKPEKPAKAAAAAGDGVTDPAEFTATLERGLRGAGMTATESKALASVMGGAFREHMETLVQREVARRVAGEGSADRPAASAEAFRLPPDVQAGMAQIVELAMDSQRAAMLPKHPELAQDATWEATREMAQELLRGRAEMARKGAQVPPTRLDRVIQQALTIVTASTAEARARQAMETLRRAEASGSPASLQGVGAPAAAKSPREQAAAMAREMLTGGGDPRSAATRSNGSGRADGSGARFAFAGG